MTKTLPTDDAQLLKAVVRLKRSLWIWGGTLAGLGLLVQYALWDRSPIIGIPLLFVGFACLWFSDAPALLAAAGMMFALSIPAYINPRLTILGPDPLPYFIAPADDTAEFAIFMAAFTLGKVILTYMAFSQFVPMRFLYGTERQHMTSSQQALIPAMVPNRVNAQLRWSLWAALGGLAVMVAMVIIFFAASAYLRLSAEIAGGLGALALSLSVGVAFSPTPFRGVAVLTMGLGGLAYLIALLVLMFVP
jgi:hypothetical protein